MPRLAAAVMIFLAGMAISAAGGVWLFKLQQDTLIERFDKLDGRVNKIAADEATEAAGGAREDNAIRRDMTGLFGRVAFIEGKMPGYLPTVDELLRMQREISAQNGRMDELGRRLEAQQRQIVGICGAFSGIAAASAKRAGC